MTTTFGDSGIANLIREAILRKEFETLTANEVEFQRLRSYFDGDQPLTFSTKTFTDTFGAAFKGFSDNWMRPIVDVVLDKLILTGIKTDDDENLDAANRLWDVFRANEIEEEQFYLHQGTLVESTAYAIVWPDEERGGARLDWQPASLIRVRYSNDDRKRAVWAVKRWETEDGDVLVTVYTDKAAWKFKVRDGSDASLKASSTDAYDEIASMVGSLDGLTRREVLGEPWPLPHRFGQVPVVEFPNVSFRSEIADATRQQDALNKTLVDMMVTGSFQAFNQRWVETIASEPVGGWNAGPGVTWHFKPTFDADNRVVPSQFGQFEAADPSTYITVIEMWLQHIAFTSRTPVRYFLKSDRGGRGDAPSGDSLQIEDKPLNDKVARKQVILANRWVDVARLMAVYVDGVEPDMLRLGDMLWKDPRYEYRLAILAEAQAMVKIGLPFRYIVKQLGLRPSEIEEIVRLKDEEIATEQAREDTIAATYETAVQLRGTIDGP